MIFITCHWSRSATADMQHVDSEGKELNGMPPPLMQRDDTGGYEGPGTATDTPAGIMPPTLPFTVRSA